MKTTGRSVDNREVLLAIRTAGDIVGELAALSDKPRSASVIAATPVTAKAVSQGAFTRYLAERPHAARAVFGAVADKLRRATRHRVDNNSTSITTRLALVLLYLAETYGRQVGGGVEIEVALSQPELATLIGASLASTQRSLRELRDLGAVVPRYRGQRIPDIARLRSLVVSDAGVPPAWGRQYLS